MLLCGIIGSEGHRLAWKMAKAKSLTVYEAAYERLLDLHKFCAEWLQQRIEMFATHLMLGRRGIVTSNPVEQYNGTMLPARESPIAEGLLMLANRIAEQTAQRKQQGIKWKSEGLSIVPEVKKLFDENLIDGLTRRVLVLRPPSQENPVAVADVARAGMRINVNSTLKVMVNTATGNIECGCCYYEEMGIPCSHAIAVIRAIGGHPTDPIWFDPGLTVDSYISEYAATPVSMGCIKIRECNIAKIQPDHRIVKAGRPKKKKRVSGPVHRFCSGCGQAGHFLNTCTNVQVDNLCQEMEKKVNRAAQIKFDEWEGELNPMHFSMDSIENVTVEVTDVEQLPNEFYDDQSDDHDSHDDCNNESDNVNN